MAGEVIYVNVEEGAKRMMNNIKLYVKLLTKFETDTKLDDLDAAVAEGNLETAKAAAHTIKGLAANLSLTELHKQSVELEAQIKANILNPEQVETVKNVFNQTKLEVQKVIAQNG